MSGVSPLTPDCGRARTAAQAVATSNTADASLLPVANLDIKLGTYNVQTKTFVDTNCASPPAVNAVKATASKTILFYLGRIISGRQDATLTAQALALTGSVGGGMPTLPLAVDADKLPSNGQPLIIHLNPTPGDDGCWHTFKDSSSSSSLLNDYIEGNVPTPFISIGDSINVKQGVDNNTLKCLGDELADHGGTWDVMLPVIPPDNHSGWIEVVGFTAIRLTLVDDQGGDKRIEAITLDNYVAPGASPGGSNNFGLCAGAPKLVQ
jgi:hypothetical protein